MGRSCRRKILERLQLENDRGGDRTHDLRIKSPLLYQLSYPANRRFCLKA